MQPGHGSISGNVDRPANRRPRHMFRRVSEKKNPHNIQFERQVAALEARQQQAQRCAIFRIFPFNFYLRLVSPIAPLHVENGNDCASSNSTPPVDSLDPSLSPPTVFLQLNISDESHGECSDNPPRPSTAKSPQSDNVCNSDFLVNSFTKTSANVKRATRKKSKKKNKRHKRGHCGKSSDGSEMQCRESKNAPSIDVADHEALTLSPKHVADILFEDTSPSSSVKEVSGEAHDSENDNGYHGSLIASISSASCSDEMELSRPTTSYLELCEQSSSNNLRYLDSTSNSVATDSSLDDCYGDSCGNRSDDAENLLIGRNECACAPSKTTDLGGFNNSADENWLDKSNRGESLSFQNDVGACNGTLAVQSCTDASGGDDFHLVISRKRARRRSKVSLCGGSSGEHKCSVIHALNEKYTGSSSIQLVKELNTTYCSRRPSNVGIQPRQVALKDFSHKRSYVCRWPQHGVALKDSITRMNVNHFTCPKENHSGKSQEYPSLGEVANSAFSEVQHVGSSKMLSRIVNTRETDSRQMGSSSASDLLTQKDVEVNCTSRDLPIHKGRPHVLLPAAVYSIDTDVRLSSSGMVSSPGPLHNFTYFEPKLQNKLENSASNKVENTEQSGMQGDLCAQAASSQSFVYAAERLNTSTPTQNDLEVGSGAVLAVEVNHKLNDRRFGSSGLRLSEMIKAANDAYEVQIAADIHLNAGHPIADFESFIYSATPVISQLSCIRSGNYLQDQLACNFNLSLWSMWEWYEEPGSCGLEVKAHENLSSRRLTCNGSEFSAYFVPYLSAVQLFGQSRKDLDQNFGAEEGDLMQASNTATSSNFCPVFRMLPRRSDQNDASVLEPSLSMQDQGELLFEYFESEQPSSRPPLFEKIKELVSGVDLSDYEIYGDPKVLENVKLCDLHPASWFSVAWYPICRIPQGNFRAAFLTYHLLGKLVPQTCSSDMAGRCTNVVSPVVGLWSYNDKGEQWFQLRDPEFKPVSLDDASKTDRAEVLKERLRTLRHGASVIASTVIAKAMGATLNHHPDYEFFLSRSN